MPVAWDFRGLDDPSHAEPSWLLLHAGNLGASPLGVDIAERAKQAWVMTG